MTAKTFGRRAPAAPARQEAKTAIAMPAREPAPPSPPIAETTPAVKPAIVMAAPGAELSVDEELRRWNEERRQTLFYRLPWKQFSLFASICFGVGSLVLPDSVNDSVDYLLWGLSAASFIVWVNGFRKPAAATPPGN